LFEIVLSMLAFPDRIQVLKPLESIMSMLALHRLRTSADHIGHESAMTALGTLHGGH